MMNHLKATFRETQKYNQLTIRIVAIFLSTLFVAGLVYTAVMPLNDYKNVIGIASFAGFLIMMIVDIVIFFHSLTIEIGDHGIIFKEKPSKRMISCEWSNIHQLRLLDYKYGIWGVRSTSKNGEAFNLKGKSGIQITLNDGIKLQLGIENIETAKVVIDHYLLINDKIQYFNQSIN